MKRFIWKNLNPAEKTDALARPQGLTDPALLKSVVQIMTQIKSGGDKALLKLTKKFDGVDVNTLKITNDEMQQAWRDLPKSQRKAINTAKKKHRDLSHRPNPRRYCCRDHERRVLPAGVAAN